MKIKKPKKILNHWINFNNQHYFDNIYKKFFFKKKKKIITKILKSNLKENDLKSKEYNINYLKKNSYNFLQKIISLIKNFEKYGYIYSNVNPLKKSLIIENSNINFNQFHFTEFEKKKHIFIKDFKKKFINVSELYKFFKKKYCGTIGFEFNHIQNQKEKNWIRKKIFFENNKKSFQTQKEILNSLIFSKSLENYMHLKYPGYKRFSLEGCDSLIPMMHEAINYGSKKKIDHLFYGMAHRGRLNFLINVMGKSPRAVFQEFSNNFKNYDDVKYHLGYNSIVKTKYGKINLNLQNNPSHLEIITPVLIGYAKAHLEHFQKSKNSILPILIHGDASFIAQGVIQETLNISQTKGYNIGGSIHIVINNQIGFTTSSTKYSRTSKNCTDILKMINSPIVHVNADYPESCINSIRFAIDFRNKFKKDICINLIGYRKYGHHESDEPSVTQPLMYKKIKKKVSVSKKYFNFLKKKHKNIKDNYIKKISFKYLKNINTCQFVSLEYKSLKFLYNNVKKKKNIHNNKKLNKLNILNLKNILKKINFLPNKFNSHILVKKIYKNRSNIKNNNNYFDWGTIENLAYAYLLNEGISIRISGEDVGRGTFFHRHSIVYDQKTGSSYIPLQNFCKNLKSKFYIWNSALSEEAILAFEYGYSINSNNSINIWEAQFGDFSNVAQVVIDQFISSGEKKWKQYSSLIMFLPHGYEGQGPEHSSCRIERYLQLCSNNNMIIANPTTPSQMFHLLRFYVLNNKKKPLIIITPKSLLRHPLAKSSLLELSKNKFKKIIKKKFSKSYKIKKIIFCTGKIYYDFLSFNKQKKNFLFIRIEQLYPFPKKLITKILKKYSHVKNLIWCQEEPKNQGAWYYIKTIFSENFNCFKKKILCISRKKSSTPATGNFKIHEEEQKNILNDVFKC